MKPLIVFDVDGTLVDSADDIIDALNYVLEETNVRPLELNSDRHLVGSGGRALIQRAYRIEGRALAADELEGIFLKFIRRYEVNVAHRSRLYPGAREALMDLTDRGYSLAVCTNKSYRPCFALLQQLRIEHLFKSICGNDSLPWSKPDPRSLLGTIERANGDPLRSVMVGDTLTDIKTALAANVPVIAVDFGYCGNPTTLHEANILISSFDELRPNVELLLPHKHINSRKKIITN